MPGQLRLDVVKKMGYPGVNGVGLLSINTSAVNR
jgi:hypothetical protein